MIFVLDIQMETLVSRGQTIMGIEWTVLSKLMSLGKCTKPNGNGMKAGKLTFFTCDYAQTDINSEFLPCTLFVLPYQIKLYIQFNW